MPNKSMIYIHVPFCASRCIYCDFYSTTHSEAYKELYTQAACAELAHRRTYLPYSAIQSIYLGGGTPSQLSVPQLHRLMQTIHQYYNVDTNAEITLEANPDDITASFIQQVRAMGFNRVSLGVQSFNDTTLHTINRRHTAREAEAAVHLISQNGIDNISIDLIYGLPHQTLQQFKHDLDVAFSLPIKHLSSYALSVEGGTMLERKIQSGELQMAADDMYVATYNELMNQAALHGFDHYEISNFALPGYDSRHNSGYWMNIPYLGIGPGAHSFDGISRQFNLPHLEDYTKSNGIPAYEQEKLTLSDKFDELMFTSLRTSKGLDLCKVKQLFPHEWYKQLMCDAAPHLSAHRLEMINDNVLKLTREGIMTSNDVISDLMRAEE